MWELCVSNRNYWMEEITATWKMCRILKRNLFSSWSTNREIVDGINWFSVKYGGRVQAQAWCLSIPYSIVDIGISATELLAVIITVRFPFSLKICALYFETENWQSFGRNKKPSHNFSGECLGNRLFGRPRYGLKYNIKLEHREVSSSCLKHVFQNSEARL